MEGTKSPFESKTTGSIEADSYMDSILTAVICIPIAFVVGVIFGRVFPDALPAAWIVELSKNEAFSAFLGAFAAFMLVVLTDWRRRRVKVRKSLPGRIASIRLFASEAHNVLGQVLAAPPADPILPLSYLRLSHLGLQEFAADLNDQLTDPQRVNVQSVCFLIDTLNARVAELEHLEKTYFSTYKQMVPTNPQARADVQRIRIEVQVAQSIADTLINTCDGYPKTTPDGNRSRS
jgi:hypothetical protein